MLTLEACKALKALGYPQDGGQWLDEHGLYYKNVSGVMAACPDSIDALDWLAEKLGGAWEREPLRYLFLSENVNVGFLDVIPATPSDLILAVAQVLA